MANLRHATKKRKTSTIDLNGLRALGLNILGKLTRIQIILLSIAACSIVLAAVTQTINNENSDATKTNAVNSSSLDLKRKTIPLTLGDSSSKRKIHKVSHIENTILPNTEGEAVILSDIQQAPKAERSIQRTIKSGDNLSTLFISVGLTDRDVYKITQSSKEGKALTQMYPGETLEFVFKANDTLSRITRKKSELESIHFTPTPDEHHFSVETLLRSPEIKQIHRNGTVEHSLSLAANKSGLSQSLTMNMANIFGGVIDFVYDVRNGDEFTVIFEELYLDGEKIDEGNIIAAQYINRGKVYNAFRYVHTNGEIGYYNEDGISMRKAFLRAPLDFTRVSSSFNLKRLHPITKKVKPHRGIDYAAPTGTPVFSVGEGRVTASGYSNANGKYVFIKHGESYTTKYLHLSKRTVKRGQRVKQGQIIGKVGCTGLCTGPHLHYEFLVNGVHRNPRTIVKKLPKAKRLAKSELPEFTKATSAKQDILRNYSKQLELASNE